MAINKSAKFEHFFYNLYYINEYSSVMIIEIVVITEIVRIYLSTKKKPK